jgi:hypothetical protein
MTIIQEKVNQALEILKEQAASVTRHWIFSSARTI